MQRLFAIAVLLITSCFGLAFESALTAAAEPNISSSYSFVKGKGKLPAWKPYFNDHNNYVARDWNKDGRLDVMAFPSTHGWHDENAGDAEGGVTFRHSPIVFLSNANSSYTVKKVPGTKINNHAAEWSGDFIAKGPIILGNGFSGTANSALIFKGLKSTPGSKFVWHGSALADINNDGILDLSGHMAGTTIYLGNGKGGFYPGKGSSPGQGNGHPGHGHYKGETLGAISQHTGAHDGTFLDLDGDGYPEMITAVGWRPTAHQKFAGGENAAITVWKNNAGKSFTKIQRLPGLKPDGNGGPAIRVVMLNGKDVLAASECGDDCMETNVIRVYSTTGGKLRLKQKFETRGINKDGNGGVAKAHPPRLIDLNCDSHKDLAINHFLNYKGNLASQHGGIWLNKGNGTFRRLKTPIFANIPKSDLVGVVIPVYANADHLMDWIVIYEDGTFGTLVARGGRNGICSRVSLIDPNGYQKWKSRKKYVIEWNPGNAGTYVKIQLFKKGNHYRWITKKTRNDGKHAWRVPSSIATSAAYKVKITSTKNKKLTDNSDNNFTITK
jgi:hypothetical protein